MDTLVDILVALFAALTVASLQLGTGTLLLLYHESLGRKVPKKVKRVTSGFIFGSLLFSILTVATAMLVILIVFGGPLKMDGLVFLVSATLAVAIIVLFLYYRRGRNTMLWIPNWVAKYLRRRAAKAEGAAEGIALGMTTALGELPFALIIIIIAANSLLNLPRAGIILAIVVYGIITVMPLMITKMVIRNGKTLAEIQKWRVKNKTFFRIFSGICYIVLALFIMAFKLLEGAW